jgi:hypothetical protein
MRINVDFPAPLGPRSPNIPGGTVSVTFLSAWTPFAYLLDTLRIRSSTGPPGDG